MWKSVTHITIPLSSSPLTHTTFNLIHFSFPLPPFTRIHSLILSTHLQHSPSLHSRLLSPPTTQNRLHSPLQYVTFIAPTSPPFLLPHSPADPLGAALSGRHLQFTVGVLPGSRQGAGDRTGNYAGWAAEVAGTRVCIPRLIQLIEDPKAVKTPAGKLEENGLSRQEFYVTPEDRRAHIKSERIPTLYLVG